MANAGSVRSRLPSANARMSAMTKYPLSFNVDIGELRGNDFHKMQQDLLRRVHAVQRELTATFAKENPGVPCVISTHQDEMLMVVTVGPATLPE